jgi:hypothetical protein
MEEVLGGLPRYTSLVLRLDPGPEKRRPRTEARGVPARKRKALPPKGVEARSSAKTPAEYTEVSGLTQTEAEELLCWLQANGYRDCVVADLGDLGFRVRYR